MKQAGVLICLLFMCCVSFTQAQIVSPEQRQDSARVVMDSTVVIQSDSVTIVTNQPTITPQQKNAIERRADSVITGTSSDAFGAPSYLFKPSPRKAVIYSAIFPGLGQIYNRKYWKLPIVYGGLVTFTYFIIWNNGYYRDYFGAYADIMDDNPNTNRWHDMLPYGQTPDGVDRQWFTGVLKDRKDYYRYYRDFSIIGTVAWYLLAMVDSYVDAQLFDFNMSPDLSMRVEPTFISGNGTNYVGKSFGLQMSIRF